MCDCLRGTWQHLPGMILFALSEACREPSDAAVETSRYPCHVRVYAHGVDPNGTIWEQLWHSACSIRSSDEESMRWPQVSLLDPRLVSS